MGHEVQAPGGPVHDEHRFYKGDLVRIEEETGQYGPQLKWITELDDDDPWENEDGTTSAKETWSWCSQKLTTHEKNKFRKYVKGLTGEEPVVGELFEEQHYTRTFYEDNPDKDPVALTGREQPWRVALMFEHTKKADGTPTESVSALVRADKIS